MKRVIIGTSVYLTFPIEKQDGTIKTGKIYCREIKNNAIVSNYKKRIIGNLIKETI